MSPMAESVHSNGWEDWMLLELSARSGRAFSAPWKPSDRDAEDGLPSFDPVVKENNPASEPALVQQFEV